MKAGTKVYIYRLESMEEFVIYQEYINARRTGKGRIVEQINKHSGVVWLIEHEDNIRAAYTIREFWTADDWRTGKEMKEETYHLWIAELVEKFDLDHFTIHHFYEEIKDAYMREKGIEEMVDVHNDDHVVITKKVEDAINRWYPTYPVNILRRRGAVEERDLISLVLKWGVVISFSLAMLIMISMVIFAGYLAIDIVFGD